jgi:hypothetical protein
MIGRKVVASGDSAKEVFEKARKDYPEKMPVLAFIPKRGINITALGVSLWLWKRWNSHIKKRIQCSFE